MSGGRRVTMADVAAACDVSVMTVSYVFNRPDRVAHDTRARVQDCAQRLGYRRPDPRARSLRLQRSRCLGVVLGEHLRYAFEDPMASRFLAGVSDELARTGHGLMIIPTTGRAEDADRVLEAAVDAFVVWTTTADDPGLRAAVASGRDVVVHAGPRVRGVRCVGIDDRAAASAIAASCFHGSVRPAVLSFPLTPERAAGTHVGLQPRRAVYPVTRARLQGVADHCREAGIDPAAVTVSVAARNDAPHGRAAARDLLTHRPDAVLAMSDELADVLIDEAERAGLRVPEDLVVTGWDDGDTARRRGLTTVVNDLRGQGAACARVALGSREPVRTPWRIVQRVSTDRTPR